MLSPLQVAGYGTEALEMSRCVRGCVSNTLCRLTCAQLLTINNTCKGDGVPTFLMPCSFQEDNFLANFINGAAADHIYSYRRFTGACEIDITFCCHRQTFTDTKLFGFCPITNLNSLQFEFVSEAYSGRIARRSHCCLMYCSW